MDDALIANMRARVAKCRMLARGIGDDEVRNTLLQMAEEGEADIARLLAEEGKQS